MSTTDAGTATMTLTDNEAHRCEAETGAELGWALPTPSPLTLVRFATATDRPAFWWADGEVPSLRKAAELIRFLALVAGRRTESGLALDVPARLLDQEFGQGRVARFEAVDFPATLTHEPTRRFLSETGLPEDDRLFQQDPDAPLRTLAEYYEDEHPGGSPAGRLPDCADHLIHLGNLANGTGVLVDGATGTILTWTEPETSPHPLTTDASTLAATLWLLHREHRTNGAI